MLNRIAGAANSYGRISISPAGGINEEGVAFGVIFAVFEMLRHVHEPAVSGTTGADRDRFGNDVAGGFIRPVDHLGPGILVLTVAGQRDRKHFAPRFPPFQNDPGIFHGQARTNIAVDPFNLGFLVGQPPFGDEVENIGRPVLDRDVLDLRTLQCDQLDHGAMQGSGIELGRGATFHVSHFRAFIDNDEGPLKLSEIFGIDPEVGLQRVLHFHAGRNVDERAAAEDGGVQRAELVVPGRDHFAEPLSENLGMIF